MAKEINLVPDIKGEMIRALKLRNFIFFLSIVVAGASVAVTVLFGMIAGAQQMIVDSKKTTVENLSRTVNSYADLTDFLTIKDQLGNLSTIADNKKVLSRTFNVLSALLPSGADTITMSELSISLSSSKPTISFDAQADAKKAPFIDYNVLDSFKKSMQYMTYDYGRYVDKSGAEIPAYCIIETGPDGATLKDPSQGIYAYWTINVEGCNPSPKDHAVEEYLESTVEYEGTQVVRIWRTPQFDAWYKDTPSNDGDSDSSTESYMTLGGQISGIEHFESRCTRYHGTKTIDGKINWESTNESCMLVPEGSEGIAISDSSNGRGSTGDLVLRFSAKITLNPEVFKFSNKHMLAFAPEGRYNVTDSYTQIQAMFGERAADCAADDAACASTPNNADDSSKKDTNNTEEDETKKENK